MSFVAEMNLRRAKCIAVGMMPSLKLFSMILVKQLLIQTLRSHGDPYRVSPMNDLGLDPVVFVERRIGTLRARLVSERGLLVFRVS
jgi:hypothetical protein